MTTTVIGDVTDQVQKYWAPLFMKELRESLLLGALVNKDYQGEIKAGGDTVYVSQINALTGSLGTVGTDADTFTTQKVSMTRIAITANKRATAAYEFEDLATLQSQLDSQDSELRASLLYAVQQQVNDYLYTLVAPSTAAPDHTITGVADLNATQMSIVRIAAATAKWDRSKPWYALLDPSYYGDVLDDATLASSDFTGDRPMVGGQIVMPRFGFNVLEDNSKSVDTGLFFHPDFMHLVMQTMPTIKVSDLHSQKRFGYVISADMIFGAKLGVAGNLKHITVAA